MKLFKNVIFLNSKNISLFFLILNVYIYYNILHNNYNTNKIYLKQSSSIGGMDASNNAALDVSKLLLDFTNLT